jgi:hypothetical protein
MSVRAGCEVYVCCDLELGTDDVWAAARPNGCDAPEWSGLGWGAAAAVQESKKLKRSDRGEGRGYRRDFIFFRASFPPSNQVRKSVGRSGVGALATEVRSGRQPSLRAFSASSTTARRLIINKAGLNPMRPWGRLAAAFSIWRSP